MILYFFKIGDPYGNRTHDSALRGLRLNRLTKGPFKIAFSKATLILYHIFYYFVNVFTKFLMPLVIVHLILYLVLLNTNTQLKLQKL